MKRSSQKTKGRPQPSLAPSPHLLDLTPHITPMAEQPLPPVERHAWWQRALDERIHLRDLRHRYVSVRPRGWRDFPAKRATNLVHAAIYAIERFFKDHPLADLTIVTVIHFIALSFWHVFIRPFALVAIAMSASTSRSRAKKVIADARRATLLQARKAAVLQQKPVTTAKTEPKPAPLPTPIVTASASRRPERSPILLAFARSALTLAVFALPFGAFVAYSNTRWSTTRLFDDGKQAFALLENAGRSAEGFDFPQAHDSFVRASAKFTGLKRSLGAGGVILDAASRIASSTNAVLAAPALLDAADAIARGGEVLTGGLAIDRGDLLKTVTALRLRTAGALPYLRQANATLASIDENSLPARFRSKMAAAKRTLPRLVQTLTRGARSLDLFTFMLGAGEPKRFLIVFQNSAELRPTGGFIGSLAMLDVKNGKIMALDVPGGGSYDLNGTLKLKLASPQPLQLINPQWQFQDANWDPDFPISARRLAYFFEKSGRPTVDGVISVNETVIERLLAATGPVELAAYGKTITAENFYDETQRAVELDYDKTKNQPKQFIADLAPLLIDKLLSGDELSSAKTAGTLQEALNGKDMQLWFRDGGAEKKAAALGWTGERKSHAGDYLEVVHANIAGQKTDRVIRETIDHDVVVGDDGSAVATVRIARTHTGIKGAPFTGVRNVDYVRVYAPLGSTLIAATGFDVPDAKLFKTVDPAFGQDADLAAVTASQTTDASGTASATERGATVFGNWIQTDPGQTSVVTLTYRLPAGIITFSTEGGESTLFGLTHTPIHKTLSYSLLTQKQSGAPAQTITSRIALPRGYALSEPSSYAIDGAGFAVARRTLARDTVFSAVATRR